MTDARSVNIALILFGQYTEKDMEFLLKLDKIGFEQLAATDYLERLAAGSMTLWRITGPAEGIVLLSLTPRAIWIEGLAGNGLLGAAESIRDALGLIRQKAGKSVIQGATHRPGLRRLYERMGHKAVATIMEAD